MTEESASRRLDPQVRVLLDRVKQSTLPPFHAVEAEEARRMYREACRALQPEPPTVEGLSELSFAGPGGPIAMRLYRGRGAPDTPVPVIVFFHGGGFTVGDLDTHDVPCRTLANFARCAVLSVDYRLAPEHKFPAAFHDCVEAVRWTAENAARLGFDPERIVIAGDSAGGTLAAGATLALRGSDVRIARHVLIYPGLDMRGGSQSHSEFAKGYLLEREDILWFMGNYLKSEADARDWRASPMLAPDHSGLPPVHIITAGFDPLRDEGLAYADKLTASGAVVTYECFEGMIHGFVTMGGALAAADHALYRVAQAMRMAFAEKAGSN